MSREYRVLKLDMKWSDVILADDATEAVHHFLTAPNAANPPKQDAPFRLVKVVSTGEIVEFAFVSSGRYRLSPLPTKETPT